MQKRDIGNPGVHAPGGARKKRHPELFLQTANVGADRRQAGVQAFRRPGQMLFLGHGHEGPQMIVFHNAPPGVVAPSGFRKARFRDCDWIATGPARYILPVAPRPYGTPPPKRKARANGNSGGNTMQFVKKTLMVVGLVLLAVWALNRADGSVAEPGPMPSPAAVRPARADLAEAVLTMCSPL